MDTPWHDLTLEIIVTNFEKSGRLTKNLNKVFEKYLWRTSFNYVPSLQPLLPSLILLKKFVYVLGRASLITQIRCLQNFNDQVIEFTTNF